MLVVGGGGSIPLYAVDAALVLGAASVTYVDTKADRLAVAEALGATLRLTEWGGRCTSIGQLAAEGALPLFELYTRGVRLDLSRGMARPAMPAILGLVAAGRLRPQLVTTATVDWEDAPRALLEPAHETGRHARLTPSAAC